MKCLIVEDDKAQRREYMQALHDLGFTCLDTNSVEQAMYLLKSNEFDIVILEMRVGDGMTVPLVDYLEMRGDPGVIILVTGSSEFPNGEIGSIWPRIDYVFRKPVQIADLVALIAHAVPSVRDSLELLPQDQPPVARPKRCSR